MPIGSDTSNIGRQPADRRGLVCGVANVLDEAHFDVYHDTGFDKTMIPPV